MHLVLMLLLAFNMTYQNIYHLNIIHTLHVQLQIVFI